jgi:hypothetical protein
MHPLRYNRNDRFDRCAFAVVKNLTVPSFSPHPAHFA